jgi:hypothetical protein
MRIYPSRLFMQLRIALKDKNKTKTITITHFKIMTSKDCMDLLTKKEIDIGSHGRYCLIYI